MENNKKSQRFNTQEYCLSFYRYPPYFGNDFLAARTWDPNNPYRIQNASEGSFPNLVLLTPAIFGGLGSFISSFLINRHRLSGIFKNRYDTEGSRQSLETYPSGLYKAELFLNVLSILALLGCTVYVAEEIIRVEGINRFFAVVIPVLIILFLFASEHHLLYTIWPGCYEGVVGHSALGQFWDFVALSIGSISVGQSTGITARTTGTRLLIAQENLFNLFVLALLISLIL